MAPPAPRSGWILGALLAVALAAPPAARARAWTDPTPAERALQRGQVEPGADAEVLLWETYVIDGPRTHPQDCVFEEYLRVKIFTAAGAERFSRHPLRYPRGMTISGVRARTVAPDGTVSELSRDAVFTTTDEKRSGEEWKVTTLAVPNVTPGSIVEISYQTTLLGRAAHHVEVYLQSDVPVVERRVRVQPWPWPRFSMRVITLGAATDSLVRDANGYFVTAAHRLPAIVEEPFMPPMAQVRASLLFYYVFMSDEAEPPAVFWQKEGTAWASAFDRLVRPNRDIRLHAAALTAGGSNDDERLRLLFDWCRQNIHNRSNDLLEDGPADLKARDEASGASKVFRDRAGSAVEINLLFASLARAAGFEVCLAATANRAWRLFDPAIKSDLFLTAVLIAVRLDGAWQLLDPGTLTIPYSGLRWQHEGSWTLLCIPRAAEIVGTPVSLPEHSLRFRSARLALDEQGTLEGDVRVVLTGHRNAERRIDEAGQPLSQREQRSVERLLASLGAAEISNLHVAEDVPDTTSQYEESFHLRIPDYATRVGRRVLLQPSIFERGRDPLFPASQRTHPACFPYPWSELDSITIALPPELDPSEIEQPMPVEIPGVGQYVAATHFDAVAHALVYVRVLRFGDNGSVCFPLESYAGLKQAFDAIHRRDESTLVLQRARGR